LGPPLGFVSTDEVDEAHFAEPLPVGGGGHGDAEDAAFVAAQLAGAESDDSGSVLFGVAE
jgi:hypothetical protein